MSESGGVYKMNERRFARLPVSWENRLRLAVYGGIGAAASIRWRPEQIFLLSHMRAGSSLTSQLLGGHPEVLGYGELHLHYHHRFDRLAVRGKVITARRALWPSQRFVYDKVLHDWLVACDRPSILDHPRSHVAFLVRRPEDTLRSLSASFGQSPDEAIEYYESRLASLAQAATRLGPERPCVALRYEDVVDRTDETFELLEQWLGLRSPLSEHYQPFARGNDRSANLEAGRILRDGKIVDHVADVPEHTVVRGRQAFESAWETLSTHCRTLG